MVTLDALKQAITDLERLAGNDADGRDRRPAVDVLARLYATYAQAMLEAYGIRIDLPQVCGDRKTDQNIWPNDHERNGDAFRP